MLQYLDILYILISTFAFSLYSIFTKKVKVQEGIIFLFWVHSITYLGFVAIYLYRKFIIAHDVDTIEQLIHNYTFYNSPLYILLGFTYLATFIIYAKLIDEFPVSKVLPFIQISLLFTIFGYFILGDPFSFASFIGVLIVCLGAIISPLDHMPGFNIFFHLKQLPRKLVYGVLIESCLTALRAWITFLLTQDTRIDEYVMTSLKHVFPFAFVDPFYFNLGSRFFVTLMFLSYIYAQGKVSKIMPVLKANLNAIFSLGALYLTFAYTYQRAYELTADKDILAACSKLNIPIVLILSFILLGEELNMQKIIGSILIVGGGMIALFL